MSLTPQLITTFAAALLAFVGGALTGNSKALASLSRYRKTVVTVGGALVTWALSTYPTDPTVQRWGGLASALLTALSVYAIPNEPPAGEPADPGMSEQDPAPPLEPDVDPGPQPFAVMAAPGPPAGPVRPRKRARPTAGSIQQ